MKTTLENIVIFLVIATLQLALPVWLVVGTFSSTAMAAEDIADVSDLSAIRVQTNDIGIVIAGDVKSVLANYPALATKLKNALIAKLQAEDTISAKVRIDRLIAAGIPLTQTVRDAIAARVETLRAQRETALMTVKDTDPGRALAKMNELISKGIPITIATQNAVKAAQPIVPVVPPPTDDGL